MATKPYRPKPWTDALHMAGHRPVLFSERKRSGVISVTQKENGHQYGSRCEACGAYWPIVWAGAGSNRALHCDYNIEPCPGEPEEKEQ